jgi:hypothetical protein
VPFTGYCLAGGRGIVCLYSKGEKIGEMPCDLCGRPVSSEEVVIVPSDAMRGAVLRGFDPFKTPGISFATGATLSDFAVALGMTPEMMYQGWKQRALADTTDWGLCPSCAKAFSNATGWSPKPNV